MSHLRLTSIKATLFACHMLFSWFPPLLPCSFLTVGYISYEQQSIRSYLKLLLGNSYEGIMVKYKGNIVICVELCL